MRCPARSFASTEGVYASPFSAFAVPSLRLESALWDAESCPKCPQRPLACPQRSSVFGLCGHFGQDQVNVRQWKGTPCLLLPAPVVSVPFRCSLRNLLSFQLDLIRGFLNLQTVFGGVHLVCSELWVFMSSQSSKKIGRSRHRDGVLFIAVFHVGPPQDCPMSVLLLELLT